MTTPNKIKTFNWKHIYYGIFLIPLIVNPFAAKPFEIPKQSWMILFIAIFMAVAGIQFLRKKTEISFNKNVAIILALWLIFFAISTIFSISPVESFWGSFERMQGMLTMLYYILHFLICLQLFKDQKEQNVLINIILAVGCVLSVHAILQWLGIDPLPIGDISEASGRSYSTIGQPSLLGQWLIVPFFSALIIFFETKKTVLKKVLFGAAILLISSGLILTFNRASLLAIVLVIGILILYEKKVKLSRVAIIIGAVLILGMIAAIFFGGTIRSISTRIVLWENSIPLILNNILFGSGLETYYQSFQTVLTKDIYLTETLYNIPDRVHNETLQVLLDQGLLGLGLYLFNILFLGWIYIKQKAKTTAAKIALFAIIASIISLQFSFAVSSHMIILLGLWAILLHSTIKFKSKQINAKIPLKITALIIIGVFSLFSISHSYSINRANVLLVKGIEAFFEDYEHSFQTFQDMLKAAPNYRHLHHSAIHFLSIKAEFSQHPELQETLIKNAKDLKIITNNGFHYNLSSAKIALALNNYEEAVSHFREASQKAPNLPIIYQEWGEAAFNNEDLSVAVENLERLRDLAPPYWQSPDPEVDNEKYSEQHRIFKKTHSLFYNALGKLSLSYRLTNQPEKAEELETKLI